MTQRARPIAAKLIRKMDRYARGKVIDLDAVRAGRAHAEELQKMVATQEELAGLHSAQAVYVYTQNQVSVASEQLTMLDEMDRFVKIIFEAYVNYQTEAVLLGGLPDVAESRPHSRVNSR